MLIYIRCSSAKIRLLPFLIYRLCVVCIAAAATFESGSAAAFVADTDIPSVGIGYIYIYTHNGV